MGDDSINCWKKVATVLNIIVSVLAMFSGVNNILYWMIGQATFCGGVFVGLLFYGLTVIGMGLCLLLVEMKYKADTVKSELCLLTHYRGRACFVFFLALLAYTP